MTTLAQLIKDTSSDLAGDVDFRKSYSGRGMYGAECVGIVGSHQQCMSIIAEVIKELHSVGDDGFDDNVDELMCFETDSMGRDMIYYWPQIQWEGEPDEDEFLMAKNYEDGQCPDCGEDIPPNMPDGGACDNCGHVFHLPE